MAGGDAAFLRVASDLQHLTACGTAAHGNDFDRERGGGGGGGADLRRQIQQPSKHPFSCSRSSGSVKGTLLGMGLPPPPSWPDWLAGASVAALNE